MPALDSRSLLATWERGIRETSLERTLTLLAAAMRCSPEDAAAMDVGTRDVLLAGVLERTAGGLIWGRTQCAACGEQLDVPVDVAAIARLPTRDSGEPLLASVDGAAVPFRLPTTADLQALRGADPGHARRELLTGCLRWAEGEVPDTVAEAVDAAMEQASPAGAIEMVVGCPSCDTAATTALDMSVLLWAEVEARAVALMQDVHALAIAYGWTEADVLLLSPERRAAYLHMAGT